MNHISQSNNPILKKQFSSIINMMTITLMLLVLFFQHDPVLGIGMPDPLLQLSDNFVFDPDAQPGDSEEFKVEIGGGKEICFYQYIPTGSQLFASFQVLKGSDRNIDFVVRGPDSIVMEGIYYIDKGNVNRPVIDQSGVYSLCLSNFNNRFSSKLVYFYLIVSVSEQWDEFAKEIVEYQSTVGNVSTSLETVQRAIQETRVAQIQGRMFNNRDWYKLKLCEQSVQRWSIAMTLLMVGSSLFQTYFVRKLFSSHLVTPASKPRA